MKVHRVKVAEHQYVWLVLNDDFLPIKPIKVFIRYLHHTEKSPDTIQSYATHLKLFWEYLQETQKNWQTISIADFAEFVHWLRSQAHYASYVSTYSCNRINSKWLGLCMGTKSSW